MTDKHEFQWAENLPHMGVRRFIAERLRSELPSLELDEIVCRYLNIDRVVPCTSNLQAAISLIPRDWWWHLSHLEAKVIPTTPVNGAPVSNAQLYDFYGKPIGFAAMTHERSTLAVAVCEALLKAYYDLPSAFVVEASASAHVDFMSKMQRLKHSNHNKRKYGRAKE
jgi:hypothetical protein